MIFLFIRLHYWQLTATSPPKLDDQFPRREIIFHKPQTHGEEQKFSRATAEELNL